MLFTLFSLIILYLLNRALSKGVDISLSLLLAVITCSSHPKGLRLKSQELGLESQVSAFDPLLARFLKCRVSSGREFATPNRIPVSSNPSSKYQTPRLKLPELVKIIRQSKFTLLISALILGLSPTFPSLEHSIYSDVILRSKPVSLILRIGLPGSSFVPHLKPNLPSICTDLILRPKFMSSISTSSLGLGLVTFMMQFKPTRLLLLPPCLDISFPETVSSVPACLGILSILPLPQARRLIPARYPVVDTPPSPPSPPPTPPHSPPTPPPSPPNSQTALPPSSKPRYPTRIFEKSRLEESLEARFRKTRFGLSSWVEG